MSTTTEPSSAENVVIFADDQQRWHDDVFRTQAKELASLKNLLSNCEIRQALNAGDLFTRINEALTVTSIRHIVIFLDLNFPTVQAGLEALNRLKRNKSPRIRQIPVFVYSISKDDEEVSAVYARQAAGFYHKLKHPEVFWNALRNIDTSTSLKLPRAARFDASVDPIPSNDIPERYLIV